MNYEQALRQWGYNKIVEHYSFDISGKCPVRWDKVKVKFEFTPDWRCGEGTCHQEATAYVLISDGRYGVEIEPEDFDLARVIKEVTEIEV